MTENTERRRPAGRPARISRDAVVEAVLEIGLDRATVSAVAARLDVDPSTLYGHVKNRDDMLAAAADAALARMEWPHDTASGWRSFLEALADALWELYRSTPGLAAHLRGMRSLPPALAEKSMQAVRTLCTTFCVPLHDAALVVDTVADSVTDSYLLSTQLDAPASGDPDGGTQREAALAALQAAGATLQNDYAEILRTALGSDGAPSDWWKRKVRLILDGLAHRLGD